MTDDINLELAARKSRMRAAEIRREPRGIVTIAPSHRRTVETGQPRDGEILRARSTDDEASAILDDLDKLQTLMALEMHRGPVWRSAWELVQRTRVLIVERCGK